MYDRVNNQGHLHNVSLQCYESYRQFPEALDLINYYIDMINNKYKNKKMKIKSKKFKNFQWQLKLGHLYYWKAKLLCRLYKPENRTNRDIIDNIFKKMMKLEVSSLFKQEKRVQYSIFTGE